ncbi:hypothetical protein MLD38_006757 [Melastoma candidum]|uniref:Uncharacterized protein n=1 Tax=Melastoma candidum TaxID=119954 RepID=A0ACB9RQ47_9MYRT|nr:hypothetical protein MLD38_006757 [Melastoma candidum]
MAPKAETPAADSSDSDPSFSADPIFHALRLVPFCILRPPRLRLKLPSPTLPSPMTVFTLLLLTYFLVVSGFVYDVIVEPPSIGSSQDPSTESFIGSFCPGVMTTLFIRIKIPAYLN